MDGLYPPVPVRQSLQLRVSDLHTLHVEEAGNPDGTPVLFLHGGPGGGCQPFHRQFFDPQRFRIVLFDQRGCGRSTPHAELRENTTWDLIDDIERIRDHLGIERWMVFGGSWGSTLALAYAIRHTDRVRSLILRGIFLLRPEEIAWFYQEGCSWIYPDAWERFLAPIPERERGDLLNAYHRRLTSDDDAERRTAAIAWSRWEGATSNLRATPEAEAAFADVRFAEAFARIECHYFVNGGFFERPDWILANADRLRDVPGAIVQGRYDVVCPMRSAWELSKAWPRADLRIVPDAGHSATEPGTLRALLEAVDSFADCP